VVFGLIGGFAGGLLGVGGGAIYVPTMVLFLDEQQHVAQGASLAAIIATGMVGGITHLQRGNVDIATAARVVPPAVVAGFGAAFLAAALPVEVLQRIFAVIILYVAVGTIMRTLRQERIRKGEGI